MTPSMLSRDRSLSALEGFFSSQGVLFNLRYGSSRATFGRRGSVLGDGFGNCLLAKLSEGSGDTAAAAATEKSIVA